MNVLLIHWLSLSGLFPFWLEITRPFWCCFSELAIFNVSEHMITWLNGTVLHRSRVSLMNKVMRSVRVGTKDGMIIVVSQEEFAMKDYILWTDDLALLSEFGCQNCCILFQVVLVDGYPSMAYSNFLIRNYFLLSVSCCDFFGMIFVIISILHLGRGRSLHLVRHHVHVEMCVWD